MDPNRDKLLLIVEDENSLKKALEEKCSHLDFKILTASDGQEALKIAEKNKPDLILLDIIMPKMDGITFLQNLRSKEWGKLTKVIILTNQTDQGKISGAVAEGVLEYYIKSDISLERIIQAIKAKFGLS